MSQKVGRQAFSGNSFPLNLDFPTEDKRTGPPWCSILFLRDRCAKRNQTRKRWIHDRPRRLDATEETETDDDLAMAAVAVTVIALVAAHQITMKRRDGAHPHGDDRLSLNRPPRRNKLLPRPSTRSCSTPAVEVFTSHLRGCAPCRLRSPTRRARSTRRWRGRRSKSPSTV